jgi:hypothetical protein
MLNHGALNFESVRGTGDIFRDLKKAVGVFGLGGYYFHGLTIVRCLAVCCLAAGADGEAERERVKAGLKRLLESERLSAEYLYERRTLRKEYDGAGKIKTESDVTTRRDPWEELIVTRVIAKDGKPLGAREAAEQEEKLRKSVEERRRKKKDERRDDGFLEELPAAMNFEIVGRETRGGRVLDVLACSPRPGYAPKNTRAKAFTKLRGKLWLDRESNEFAKIEAEIFEDVSMGFGALARIEKGTQFELERYPFGEHWFATWQRVRLEAKVLMMRSMRREFESRFQNYAKPPGR